MSKEIDNRMDYIDSRDIMERIKNLEEMRDEYEDDWNEAPESEELDSLLAIQEECEGYGDWKYGETLIRRSEWVEYCQEFCVDVGYVSSELPGLIENNIDWKGVADDMEQDYMTVDFDGVEYLMRA